MVEKVISGGQTGADRMGLEVAEKLGIPTGGTAPKDYWTENGPDWSLEEFGLVQHTSKKYEERTVLNVVDSDGTVLFGNESSPGSMLTRRLCKVHKRPYKANPTKDELVQWLADNKIKTLNVAGNRGSKLTKRQLDVYQEVLFVALVVNRG